MPKLYEQIYERFQLGPANHMTHLDNLESILKCNELRSYNLMRDHAYQNLSNQDVQEGRAAIQIPCTGRALHDYVPLYFGNRTPMVAANQEHNENLVFLRFSLEVLTLDGVVISDGNARAKTTQFRLFQGLEDLGLLDPKAINTTKYAHDQELKRRKQAEILVPERLSLDHVLDIMCYSSDAAKRILPILQKYGKKWAINVRPGAWYFSTPKTEGQQ